MVPEVALAVGEGTRGDARIRSAGRRGTLTRFQFCSMDQKGAQQADEPHGEDPHERHAFEDVPGVPWLACRIGYECIGADKGIEGRGQADCEEGYDRLIPVSLVCGPDMAPARLCGGAAPCQVEGEKLEDGEDTKQPAQIV